MLIQPVRQIRLAYCALLLLILASAIAAFSQVNTDTRRNYSTEPGSKQNPDKPFVTDSTVLIRSNCIDDVQSAMQLHGGKRNKRISQLRQADCFRTVEFTHLDCLSVFSGNLGLVRLDQFAQEGKIEGYIQSSLIVPGKSAAQYSACNPPASSGSHAATGGSKASKQEQ